MSGLKCFRQSRGACELQKQLLNARSAFSLEGLLAFAIVCSDLLEALNDFTTTIVDEEEDFIGGHFPPALELLEAKIGALRACNGCRAAWNVLAGTFSLVWSLAEMLVCVVAALIAAVKMTRICGIMPGA